MTRLPPCRTRCACRMMRAARGLSKTAAKIMLPCDRAPMISIFRKPIKIWQRIKPCATTVSGLCFHCCPKISKLFGGYAMRAHKKWQQQNRCGTRVVANVAKFLRKMNFEISLIRAPLSVWARADAPCVSGALPFLETFLSMATELGNKKTLVKPHFFYKCFQSFQLFINNKRPGRE